MNISFEIAKVSQIDEIWKIFQFAIAARKAEGSEQWQDGYPNKESILADISKGDAWILRDQHNILVYAAVIFDGEPAYEKIKGQWLSNQDYITLHRVAVSSEAKGKGLVQQLFTKVEELAISKGVYAIRVDTNFDNFAMLHILKKLDYTYCGEVLMRNSPRKAFEKILFSL